jgi:DNA-binding response OmpR family regulator
MERPILIVDDDDTLRSALAERFAEEGEFRAVGAATLNEAEETLQSDGARFDTVLLDIGLPDGDGRDYCQKLRRDGHKMPIIMLTGSDEETDVVRGLDAGANDYVAKPFRLNELLARIRTQLRTFENSEDAVFTIGPYTFRPAAKLLQHTTKNSRIHLTNKEVLLLKFLRRAGKRPVGRQELLNEVWGYNPSISTHTLETHVYRLRQKMEPNPGDPRLLQSQRNGYLLDPEGDPSTDHDTVPQRNDSMLSTL